MSFIALPTSLQSAKVDTYSRLDGTDVVQVQAFVSANPMPATTGTLAAAAQSVTVTDLGDMDGALVATSGTFSGTIAFEASRDGTNWYAVLMTRTSAYTQESTRALTGATLEGWRANISGWLQFRVRCSAYTSGTAQISISPVSVAFEPPANTVAATQSGTWTVQPGSTANTVPWLVTNRGNVFFNESVTPLAAAATLTGTSRDVGIAASAVQPYSAFNVTAFADQAGTMRIEMSNDNTTWRRATADSSVTANSVVTLSVPVSTRYHRVIYVNGATLQGAFMVNSSYTAA